MHFSTLPLTETMNLKKRCRNGNSANIAVLRSKRSCEEELYNTSSSRMIFFKIKRATNGKGILPPKEQNPESGI